MKSFIIYLISLLVGIETKYLLIKLKDPNALRHGVVGQPMQGQMVPKGPAGVMPRIPAQGGGGLGKLRLPRMPRRPAGGGGLGQNIMPRRPAGGGGLGQSVMPRIPAQGGGGLGLSVMPRIPAKVGGGLGQSVMPRIPAQVGGGLGQIAGVVPRRPAMVGHVLPQMMPILSPSMGAVPIVPILMGGWGSSSSSSSR